MCEFIILTFVKFVKWLLQIFLTCVKIVLYEGKFDSGDELMGKFSEHLRKLLGERQMSAAELARQTGLSEAAISGYLNGKKEPRGAQSKSIAQALNVSLDELWQTGYNVEVEGNKVTVTVKERELLECLRRLNDDGMLKASVYINDLLNSGHEIPWKTVEPEKLDVVGMLKESIKEDFKIAARSGGVKPLNSRQKRDRERLVDGLKNHG